MPLQASEQGALSLIASGTCASKQQQLQLHQRKVQCVHCACLCLRKKAQGPYPSTAAARVDPQTAAVPSQFSWLDQWYPAALCADLEVGRPARVWLFDEPIVVLRRPGTCLGCVSCAHTHTHTRYASLKSSLLRPLGMQASPQWP